MNITVLSPAHIPELLPHFFPREAELIANMQGMGGYAVTALVNTLVERGHTVHLATLSPEVTRPVRVRGPRLALTVCPRRTCRAVRTVFRDETRFLRAAIRETPYDVAHAHWTYEYALAALGAKGPHLITVRDHAWRILRLYGLRYLPHFLIAQYVLLKGSRFTVPSAYVADYVRRRTSKRVDVVPNSLQDALLKRGRNIGTPKYVGIPVIASALNTAPFKGARTALQAFSLLKARFPEAEYLLAGPGLGEKGAIERWAIAKGFATGVTFAGAVTHADWIALVERAHVVLHPSREESFGNTLIEGMGMRRLVVAGLGVGACPQILNHGKAGVLADVSSPSGIANSLTAIFENWPRHAPRIECAANRAKRLYGSHPVAEQYEHCYQSMLSG